MDSCRLSETGRPICYEIKGNIIKQSPCICKRQDECKKDLMKIGVFNKFRESRIDNFDPQDEWQEKALLMVKNYIVHMRPEYKNLALVGNVGTGKTFLLYCLLRAAVNKGIQCKYVRYFDLVNNSGSFAEKNERSVWRKSLRDVQMLFIDDLWKLQNRDSDTMDTVQFQITSDLMDYRYHSGKPTIITSELLASEQEEIDVSVWSRFYENTWYGSKDDERYYQELLGKNQRYNKERLKSINVVKP